MTNKDKKIYSVDLLNPVSHSDADTKLVSIEINYDSIYDDFEYARNVILVDLSHAVRDFELNTKNIELYHGIDSAIVLAMQYVGHIHRDESITFDSKNYAGSYIKSDVIKLAARQGLPEDEAKLLGSAIEHIAIQLHSFFIDTELMVTDGEYDGFVPFVYLGRRGPDAFIFSLIPNSYVVPMSEVSNETIKASRSSAKYWYAFERKWDRDRDSRFEKRYDYLYYRKPTEWIEAAEKAGLEELNRLHQVGK